MKNLHSLDFDYEMFFNMHLDLLCILDKVGNFLHINQAFEQTLGYTIDDLYLQSTVDLIHPNDLLVLQEQLETLGADEDKLRFSLRVRHKNGSYRYIEWCSQFKGKYLYASARDITEHKLRAIQLQNHYLQLNAILKNNKNFVVHLDCEFNYTHCNPIFIQEFAHLYSKESLVGQAAFKDLAFMQSLEESCKKCLIYKGEVFQTETQMPNPDGTVTYILWECIALCDDKGIVSELQCIGLDITRRKLTRLAEKQKKEKEVLQIATPISVLWENILFLPLVGKLTALRAEHLRSAVLNKISDSQARFLIIDVSGSSFINIEVANYILQLNRAVKLMGCTCLFSGISPSVAQVIIELDINTNELMTTNNMQKALDEALRKGGYQLSSISLL